MVGYRWVRAHIRVCILCWCVCVKHAYTMRTKTSGITIWVHTCACACVRTMGARVCICNTHAHLRNQCAQSSQLHHRKACLSPQMISLGLKKRDLRCNHEWSGVRQERGEENSRATPAYVGSQDATASKAAIPCRVAQGYPHKQAHAFRKVAFNLARFRGHRCRGIGQALSIFAPC